VRLNGKKEKGKKREMAPNYANTKIYEIVIPGTNLSYIGHTTQALSKRANKHKEDMVHRGEGMPHRLFLAFGMTKKDIVCNLVSSHVCTNVDEARMHERAEIKRRGGDCINVSTPGRTKPEYDKDRYAENKDKMNETSRQYHLDHREEIRAKNRERVKCPYCCKELSRGKLGRHVKQACKGAPNDFVSQ
jgi:hypothetical protein